MEERGHAQAPLYTLFCPPTPNPSPSATTPSPASVKAGGGLQSYHGVAPCQKPPLPGALLGIPRASPTLSMHQPCRGGAPWQSQNQAMPACLGAQAHGHCCIFRCCFWSIKHWIRWVVARGRGQGMGAVGSTPSPAHMAQAPPLHKHTCPTSVTACVYLTPTACDSVSPWLLHPDQGCFRKLPSVPWGALRTWDQWKRARRRAGRSRTRAVAWMPVAESRWRQSV